MHKTVRRIVVEMRMMIRLFVVLCVVSLANAYPLFKQCDSRWGNDELGTSSQTICSSGCAMSSVAMGLAGRGVSTDPGKLNSWLKGHGGYVSGDLIIWKAVNAFGVMSIKSESSLPENKLGDYVRKGYVCILNVRSGGHWVLATGYAGSGVFNVNDPGYDQSSYNYNDIGTVVVYST